MLTSTGSCFVFCCPKYQNEEKRKNTYTYLLVLLRPRPPEISERGGMIRSSTVVLDNHDKLKRMRMFSFVLFTTLQTEDTCTTTN